jgi:hypothetical protein
MYDNKSVVNGPEGGKSDEKSSTQGTGFLYVFKRALNLTWTVIYLGLQITTLFIRNVTDQGLLFHPSRTGRFSLRRLDPQLWWLIGIISRV